MLTGFIAIVHKGIIILLLLLLHCHRLQHGHVLLLNPRTEMQR